MTGTQLATLRPASGGIVANLTFPQLVELGQVLTKTGFLPAAIKTPEQAVAVILKGQELGIPAMYSLSNIVVINGKPAANAELMLALIYRDHGDNALVVQSSSDEACIVAYKRRGWSDYRQHAFTIAQAGQAGLAGKGTWAQYPAAMLRARCISAVARMAFPDSIAGMYTPEELGANADPETGEILIGPPDPLPHQALATDRRAAVLEIPAPIVDADTGEILNAEPAATSPPPAPEPDSRDAFVYEQTLARARGDTSDLATQPLTDDAPEEYVEASLLQLAINRYRHNHDRAVALGLKPSQPREVDDGSTWQQVQRWADALAKGIARHSSPLNGTPAPLPKAQPGAPLATQTQVETIAKLARSLNKTVATDGLTRAEASELITRLSEERYSTRPATGARGAAK